MVRRQVADPLKEPRPVAGTPGRARDRAALRPRVAEDRAAADAPPADRGLSVDLDPLECRASVGTGEAPNHLPDARRPLDIPDPQLPRPRRGLIHSPPFAGGMEVIPHGCPECGPLGLGEPSPVAVERRGALEPHARGQSTGDASRCPNSASGPSTTVTRPAATCSSTPRTRGGSSTRMSRSNESSGTGALPAHRSIGPTGHRLARRLAHGRCPAARREGAYHQYRQVTPGTGGRHETATGECPRGPPGRGPRARCGGNAHGR